MNQASSGFFSHVIKRDGGVKPFDAHKIAQAQAQAAQVTDEFDAAEALRLTHEHVRPSIGLPGEATPHIEQIQDAVESALFTSGYPKTLRAYIVYREQHKALRRDRQSMVCPHPRFALGFTRKRTST